MAKRNGNAGGALDPALSQKKRARRRLIGAAAVALAAAIALPMLLDSEPREQLPEVEVEIPSRDMPLRPLPAQSAQAGPAATPSQRGRVDASGAVSAADPAASTPDPLPSESASSGASSPSGPPTPASPSGTRSSSSSSTAASEPSKKPSKPAAPAASGPPQSLAKPPTDAPAASSEAAETAPSAAKPSIEPSRSSTQVAAASTEAERRYGLQIGAYANPESAKTMAARARKAGVRAYTETIQTAEGTRTRVRIGPFADREAAERGRGKLKLVGIDSSLVSLQP